MGNRSLSPFLRVGNGSSRFPIAAADPIRHQSARKRFSDAENEKATKGDPPLWLRIMPGSGSVAATRDKTHQSQPRQQHGVGFRFRYYSSISNRADCKAIKIFLNWRCKCNIGVAAIKL